NGHSVLFLPPYSPDFNPIEKTWAWLKGKLRKILPSHASLDDASLDDALLDCFAVR
ncbi:transposase, partial [Bacillus thuringiensis]|uniref:transposase n=1 Tax=Bacillus thuringiensis TaxID=1428 RepID=UPI0034593539